MSGGSFDYLSIKDIDELANCRETIKRMAETIEKYVHDSEAAKQTQKIYDLFEEAERIKSGLENVWYAVEWAESGDWDKESAIIAIKKYE